MGPESRFSSASPPCSWLCLAVHQCWFGPHPPRTPPCGARPVTTSRCGMGRTPSDRTRSGLRLAARADHTAARRPAGERRTPPLTPRRPMRSTASCELSSKTTYGPTPCSVSDLFADLNVVRRALADSASSLNRWKAVLLAVTVIVSARSTCRRNVHRGDKNYTRLRRALTGLTARSCRGSTDPYYG